jgi:hypothetical protein
MFLSKFLFSLQVNILFFNHKKTEREGDRGKNNSYIEFYKMQ